MKAAAAFVLSLALSATSALAAAPREFDVSKEPALGDVYPDRVTKFADGVTGLADVVYASLPGFRPMVVDLYLPADKAPKPLIMYIHGGGWMGGHTRQSGALANFPAVLAKLASEGFVVASLEYRLSGEAPFPAQLQDARAAIRFLKANAARYGIDPARVGVWGGSAGGHLTGLVATTCGETTVDPSPAPKGSECVQAAVTWYGVFDFAPMLQKAATAPTPKPAEYALLRCRPEDCTPAQVASVSPIQHVDRNDPPMLLIHGEKDQVVDVSQSHQMEAALKSAGVPIEAIYIPAVDHSFIGQTPESTRAATLKAVNATFDFFHKTLQVPSK
ncbi:MAG: alpha/beta hydrolase [Alphaproteobacteria bacterium]|jgi:acetyl esterase/lipase|nr:alpha/beta hydrolase [Alphaproteobacteria bacterium]